MGLLLKLSTRKALLACADDVATATVAILVTLFVITAWAVIIYYNAGWWYEVLGLLISAFTVGASAIFCTGILQRVVSLAAQNAIEFQEDPQKLQEYQNNIVACNKVA
jgi:hypothetical protein